MMACADDVPLIAATTGSRPSFTDIQPERAGRAFRTAQTPFCSLPDRA
jgi:hypothetical protein